jgi:hypothetical protein
VFWEPFWLKDSIVSQPGTMSYVQTTTGVRMFGALRSTMQSGLHRESVLSPLVFADQQCLDYARTLLLNTVVRTSAAPFIYQPQVQFLYSRFFPLYIILNSTFHTVMFQKSGSPSNYTESSWRDAPIFDPPL